MAPEGALDLAYDPPGLPVLGQVLEAWRDPIALFHRDRASGHPVVRYRFGPYRYYLLNEPADVERVLVKNAAAYRKSPSYRALALVMGQGLVTSEGELWRRQRKLAQPAFHHRSLVSFVDVMRRCTEDFAHAWSGLEPGTELDVHEAMMRLTFRIVGLTLFSTDLQDDATDMGRALAFLLDFAAKRSESFVQLPIGWPTPQHRRYRRHMKVVDDLIHSVIEGRRGQVEAPADLLTLLMDADMPAHLLRDELVTLALAGHETTATTLSWTWLLLSRHPEAARRARDEIRAVAGDAPITFETLRKLDYVERVIQESMRLFPPVWALERQAAEDDEVSGVRVPEGDIVLMCQHTLHRDPRFWANPEGFEPDRFLPERAARRPRFAYFPFGGGARICIGKSFAMMEAKLILAELLRRFDLALRPGFSETLDPGITLRPKGGLPMRISQV